MINKLKSKKSLVLILVAFIIVILIITSALKMLAKQTPTVIKEEQITVNYLRNKSLKEKGNLLFSVENNRAEPIYVKLESLEINGQTQTIQNLSEKLTESTGEKTELPADAILNDVAPSKTKVIAFFYEPTADLSDGFQAELLFYQLKDLTKSYDDLTNQIEVFRRRINFE